MSWLNESTEVETAEEKQEKAQRALRNRMTGVIQKHLDRVAQEKNYDNIMSLCTYATSKNPKFQAEGQAGVEWRDEVWAKGYELLGEVEAGTRAIPTADELLAEMPSFEWPL